MEEIDALSLLKNGVISKNPTYTQAIASAFVKQISPDAFIALSGDLGTGKTTFAKGLALGMGITASVKSPSFNVCSMYDAPDGRKFVHIDAYRLLSSEAYDDLLIDEIAPSPRIVCVEWPEMVENAIASDAWRISIKILEDQSHFLILS